MSGKKGSRLRFLRVIKPEAERFWAKVDKNGPIHPTLGTSCWLWTGGVREDGYGRFSRPYRRPDRAEMIGAHRMAWILMRGSIPDGLFVCHSCDVKLCVNSAHHFLGKHAENNADRDAKGRYHNSEMDQTHCKWGHPLVGENVYLDLDGHRVCKICRRVRGRTHDAKRRPRRRVRAIQTG